MDFVADQDEVDIPLILRPTRLAFLPLLEEKRAAIESTPRHTYQYGVTDRLKLDIYHPATDSRTLREKVPVLFLAYGGGFGTGERLYRPPIDLVYRSAGAFFANHGLAFVVPDYRLVPDARFPQPAEDLRDAIRWVIDHADDAARPISLDPDNIFILGHCTGANLIMTMLLVPGLISPDIRSRVRGILLMGGLFDIIDGGTSVNHAVITQYYGSPQDIRSRVPLSLLEQAPDEVLKSLPPMLALLSEKEPADIIQSHESFMSLLERRSGRIVPTLIMKGHNHISPELALRTEKGDEWAYQVMEWIWRKL